MNAETPYGPVDPNCPETDFGSAHVIGLAKTPVEFRRTFGDRLPAAVSGVLAKRGLSDNETAKLCQEMRNVAHGGNDWIRCGSIAVPSSPAGIETLRRLRILARDWIRATPVFMSETGSPFRALVDSAVVSDHRSAVISGVSNRSTSDDGVRMELLVQRDMITGLPRGEKPKALRSLPLLGRVFDGDRIEEWRSDTNACIEGTVEFLELLNVSHETNAEDGCGDCNCDCGGEADEISWCEDFDLDEKTIRLLDRAGYGDATREFFECADDEGWEGVANLDDSEIAERLKLADKVSDGFVVEGNGTTELRKVVEKTREAVASYDPAAFAFVADFDLDGMSAIDFCDVARIMPGIVRLVDECATRGILPPVSGYLELRTGGGRYIPPGDRKWAWDPVAGTLTHRPPVDGAMSLRWDVASGVMSGIVPDGRTFSVDKDFRFMVPVRDCGPDAALWFSIGQGEIQC